MMDPLSLIRNVRILANLWNILYTKKTCENDEGMDFKASTQAQGSQGDSTDHISLSIRFGSS